MDLLLLLIFDHPVRVAADTLTLTPLKALVTGLIVLLLLGPIVLLLAASVIDEMPPVWQEVGPVTLAVDLIEVDASHRATRR